MSNYELRRHKAADTAKWIVVFVLLLATICAVISLFFMLDRQTTTTEIGAEQYIIGGLDAEGAAVEGDTSIVTRDTFTTDGLKVELADEAEVTYELSRTANLFPKRQHFRQILMAARYPKMLQAQSAL